jgi:hypothetical protein
MYRYKTLLSTLSPQAEGRNLNPVLGHGPGCPNPFIRGWNRDFGEQEAAQKGSPVSILCLALPGYHQPRCHTPRTLGNWTQGATLLGQHTALWW